MRADSADVLDGIRVIDFGRYLAGPYCASLLAQLGADVIRVEPLDGGEDRWLAPLQPDAVGALFVQANHQKRAIALDTTTAEGDEIVRQLIARADVLVANMPEPALRQRGLTYDALSPTRPDIIVTAITGFGPSGPERDRVSFDGIAQAMSGAMYLSGTPDRPAKSYVPYVDYGTALAAAFGTLAALMVRVHTGRGQQVDASLFATALTFSNTFLAEQAARATNRVGTGNRGQLYGPSDVFRTTDGFIFVQVIGRRAFERWARMVGHEEWLNDPRFDTDEGRGTHAGELAEQMARWSGERSTAAALDALARARIAAGPVLSPQQCLDHPQTAALDLFTGVEYPQFTAPIAIVASPVRLGAGGTRRTRRAPGIGEHTEHILAELGYGAADIADLTRRGVVRCAIPTGCAS